MLRGVVNRNMQRHLGEYNESVRRKSSRMEVSTPVMAKLSSSFMKNRYFFLFGGLILILGNLSFCVMASLFVVRLWYVEPIGESLSLPTMAPVLQEESVDPEASPETSELEEIQENYLQVNPDRPKCGTERELIFLVAAIDYRGDTNFLYGLSDSMRLVRVDFAVPQINVVSLPRSLLVEVPTDRIQAENPILLNQAYFFGTPGMQRYAGSGFGAGSLAETIQYNFGVTADQYAVIDFEGFIRFIDTLGGIEVDLPQEVDDRPRAYFPAGKQVLDGEQALQLARIRKRYDDWVRTDNQTIILQGILQKLKNPLVYYRLPEMINNLEDAVVTDISPEQIRNLLCVLQRINAEDILYANPSQELLVNDTTYVPSVNYEMQILRWDESFTSWLYQSLWLAAE